MGRQKKWLRKNITSLQPDDTVAQGYIMSLLEKAFVIKCLNKSKDHIEQKLLKKKNPFVTATGVALQKRLL